MSVKSYILISSAVIVVICVLAVVNLIVNIATPTKGEKIAKYANPEKALLIVDVQKDFTDPHARYPGPYKDAGEKIAVMNKLIDKAVNSGINVVYIRQENDNTFFNRLFFGGKGIKGQPGTELDPGVKVVNNNFFSKPVADAFSNPQLGEFLVNHQVDEVYLTGMDAAYCVNGTLHGALNRGYKVAVVKDAVMTNKKLENIFSSWRNDGVDLVSSQEFLKSN